MKNELVNKIVVVVDKIDVVEKRINASVKSTLEELGTKMNTMESDLQ